MTQASNASRELSPRRIIGFACNQAFIFFLVYLGDDRAVSFGDVQLLHVDVLFTLLFMVVGFVVVRLLGQHGLSRLLARPLLYVYAILAAAASLMPVYLAGGGVALLVLECLLTGVSCAFLLTAWGRAFGRVPSAASVSEVFLGSLVAAFLCWVFSLFAASDFVTLASLILPLAGVVNIEVPADGEVVEGAATAPAALAAPPIIDAQSVPARSLSLKILAGTFLFGMAAGLAGLLFEGADGSAFYPQMSMVLFGAFLIGALTLLLSDGFGRGAALNKSYRLAVFVMMVGVLVTPVALISAMGIPGQAVVFAGYLGLQVVLISLFLVMAEITAVDCALALSAGLLALFAGELVGALVSGALFQSLAAEATGLLSVLAGVVVLIGYVFLFTERDFDMLSEIVSAGDAFEEICANLTERHGLSNREAEILVFALRGRTSERIAQELVISKNTVDTHLRRIYAKCGVHSRQELLDLAEVERASLAS